MKAGCKYIIAIVFSIAFNCLDTSFAQSDRADIEASPVELIQQLENLLENDEESEPEEDDYLQSLDYYLKAPLNLNYAGESELQQLNLLSPIQINNLFIYRKLFGKLTSIYELQAIPSWDIYLIRRLIPFISVGEKTDLIHSIQKRLQLGEHSILMRVSQQFEKSKGYLLDGNSAKNFYSGNPQKWLVRYKYNYRNNLQWGITAEKDAGEQFFKGSQKNGFDFYSAHFFVRDVGNVKSLAIGDFSLNLGQGLLQWQSLAFNKGANIINVKRQSDVLRPYSSAGEIVFNRGVGITFKKKYWESTLFVSNRRLDAGFVENPMSNEKIITSLHTSGYHRTASEIEGKGMQGLWSYGGNVNYSNNTFQVSFNVIHFDFEHIIQKREYLYNLFSLEGNRARNYSIDYSYTYKNAHFFGETAIDKNKNSAFVNGLLLNADARVYFSFLYRNISTKYQSFNANAFTENTNPNNEKGFYSGVSLLLTNFLKLDAYADFYQFPWLKYRVDAPSHGVDYMLQLMYQPNKITEFYTRYQFRNKSINYNPENYVFNPVLAKVKQALRSHLSHKISPQLTFKTRTEIVWYDKKGNDPQNGFVTYAELFYKPVLKGFNSNIRLLYFETDGYNSRIYAFENDVLYGYSIPMFFDKGYRYYLNFSCDATKRLKLWIRFAQTLYADKSKIGSGLDAIEGSAKSEFKTQAILKL